MQDNQKKKQKKIFFGFNIHPSFVSAFSNDLTKIKDTLKDKPMRWVKPKNYHITLFYNGYTEPQTVEMYQEKLQKLVHPFCEISPVQYTWMGKFSPRALTLEFSNAGLHSLVQAFQQTFMQESFGLDHVHYRPHITFARHRGKVREDEYLVLSKLVSHVEVPKVLLRVEDVVLFESVMVDGQVNYQVLAKKNLHA